MTGGKTLPNNSRLGAVAVLRTVLMTVDVAVFWYVAVKVVVAIDEVVKVEREVTVCWLALPVRNPTPAPTRMATTSSPATAAPFIVEHRTAERAIRLVTRTA